MSNSKNDNARFWPGKRVIVTGGSGFLGSFVVEKLRERGAQEIIVPRSAEYDLRDNNAIHRLFQDRLGQSDPSDVVLIHLAANVGGIGANRAHPAEFFYDNPLGIFLNAAFTSCTMFPPIFRPLNKRGVTRAGLNFLALELQSPETLCGIHPEGTRGKGPDPYQLLPAEPGFGRVVLQARPIVVPVFIGGLSNDIAREVRRNFGDRDPVIIIFGDPVDLSDFDDVDPRLLRNQVKVGRRVLQDVARLAEQEKRVRQELQAPPPAEAPAPA
ncbi:MAG: NAD-dependent epimerase/dehydratase family protein [Chloroflexi bacterium]|nr:NAD-dependent epimerase/dehydratase family protein [Chloroflexota bacterium]